MAKKKVTHHSEKKGTKSQKKEAPSTSTAMQETGKTMESLKSLNAILLKETVELRQQVYSLLQSKGSLESELKFIKEEADKLRAEYKVLMEKKEEREREIESISKDKNQMEKKLAVSKRVIEELKKELDMVVKEKEGINDEKNVEAKKRSELGKAVSSIEELSTPTVQCNLDSYRSALFACINNAVKIFSFLKSNAPLFRRNVMWYLRNLGYNAGVCKTKWENFGGLIAGNYEFIDVIRCDSNYPLVRYFVDLDFATEFEIARPTTEYKRLVQSLPKAFIGKTEELEQILKVMSYAVERSMESKDLHLPPWRTHRYMQNKWFCPYKRTTNLFSTSYSSVAFPQPSAKQNFVIKCRTIGFNTTAVDDRMVFHSTRIFVEYEQPFAITYLGVSLMVIFLPISVCKDLICGVLGKHSYKKLYDNNLFLEPSDGLEVPLRMNEVNYNLGQALTSYPLTSMDLNAAEEGGTLTCDDQENDFPVLEKSHGLSSWQIIKYSFCLAPVWFITEYLSNSALANTSVASTTVLTSTSGLFTLFFGALISQDTINVPKIAAVLISMTGVAMTTIGKTWALDEKLSVTESRRHTITGDIFGLLSAASYGLFTVLLKKSAGSDGDKVHMEKIFGYIGLFTLLGLWWLIWPLNALGIEPQFKFPNSAPIRETLLVNGIVGSVISDFLWAHSVVWTTPLVATLGMSLTIPLAMMADMLIHGRHFSALYILGCVQVFAGFVIANLPDKYSFKRR